MPKYTLDGIRNLKLRPEDNQFSQCGSITVENDSFEPTVSPDLRGAGVYLWVSKDKNDGYEVLYAGKAKDGPKHRLSQHKGGINKNTATARARREQIRQCIPEEGSLEVFFRASKIKKFPTLGVDVSKYSIDEEALIMHLSPILNRSKPPVVDVDQAESFIDAMTDTFDFSNESHWSAWIHFLHSLSQERIELVEDALENVKALVGDAWGSLDIGVTGSYSLDQFCERGMSGRPVLVFGRYANVQFANKSKFALLALDEGDANKETQPDILFFEKDQKGAICYSYEDFLGLGELPSGVMEQLNQIR